MPPNSVKVRKLKMKFVCVTMETNGVTYVCGTDYLPVSFFVLLEYLRLRDLSNWIPE